MHRWIIVSLIALGLAVPAPAVADPVPFKLLSTYSRATFKSDAPLETFVGNTAADGIQGSLKMDLAEPEDATGTVKVDLRTVKTGVDKRDSDMRSENFLHTDVEANRYAVFELKDVELSGPLVPGQAVERSRRSECAGRCWRLRSSCGTAPDGAWGSSGTAARRFRRRPRVEERT